MDRLPTGVASQGVHGLQKERPGDDGVMLFHNTP